MTSHHLFSPVNFTSWIVLKSLFFPISTTTNLTGHPLFILTLLKVILCLKEWSLNNANLCLLILCLKFLSDLPNFGMKSTVLCMASKAVPNVCHLPVQLLPHSLSPLLSALSHWHLFHLREDAAPMPTMFSTLFTTQLPASQPSGNFLCSPTLKRPCDRLSKCSLLLLNTCSNFCNYLFAFPARQEVPCLFCSVTDICLSFWQHST